MTNKQQNAAPLAAPSFLLLSHAPLTDWPSLITTTLGVSAAHGAAIVLLAHVMGVGGAPPGMARPALPETVERVVAVMTVEEAPPAPKPEPLAPSKPKPSPKGRLLGTPVKEPKTLTPVKRPTRKGAPELKGVPTPATLAVPTFTPPAVPKQVWKVQPDAVLASMEHRGNPAPAKSGEGSNSAGTAETGIDAPLSMEQLEKGPVYTPFSQAPELLNRPEIQSFLKRRYTGRLAMSNGLVLLWLLIDAEGEVRKAMVLSSSGHDALDKAAMAAVDKMEFRPAVNQGKAVPVWVQLPVRYISE